MDIREFAEQLNADITAEINKNGIEDEQIWKDYYKSELASRIIDYMIDKKVTTFSVQAQIYCNAVIVMPSTHTITITPLQ